MQKTEKKTIKTFKNNNWEGNKKNVNFVKYKNKSTKRVYKQKGDNKHSTYPDS